MINQVIEELNKAFKPSPTESQAKGASQNSSFGSSHMIASCLNLMSQFQQ